MRTQNETKIAFALTRNDFGNDILCQPKNWRQLVIRIKIKKKKNARKKECIIRRVSFCGSLSRIHMRCRFHFASSDAYVGCASELLFSITKYTLTINASKNETSFFEAKKGNDFYEGQAINDKLTDFISVCISLAARLQWCA